jgi:uncharacterized protein YbjT (DUF2867 family)/membrane protease YdiL (CAAX protease family)
MRVLVAGGTGFIGRHVLRRLLEAGHVVRVLARRRQEAPDDIELVTCAMEETIDPTLASGFDAIVNLVGIAHGRDHEFERAHVEVVQNLIGAAQAAGVRRFVHVSVVDVPTMRGTYVETKRRGEECVRRSDLAWTILRPSLVYGEGDAALRNVVDGVRAIPLFPVPAGATGSLQPVDVRDVADAVELAVVGRAGEARTLDVVGPEHVDIRALVNRVGQALELPSHTLPVPRSLLRFVATVMEHSLRQPPLTRAQVDMLGVGLHGDAGMTERLLERAPRPLTPERIRALSDALPPPAVSVRAVTSAAHRAWLQRFSEHGFSLRWVLPATLAIFLLLPTWLPTLWQGIGLANATALVLAMIAMRGTRWSRLWRPSLRGASIGMAAAIAMLAVALLVILALRRWLPELAAGADDVYVQAWTVPPLVIPILLGVVLIEDTLWRGAITLPLVAKLGPISGCLLAGALFGAAHWTAGPPVLVLAAFLAGTAWSVLTVRTRSLFVTGCCHATWDLAIVALGP